VSVRYDYDSRIGQDTKVNPMTNPAGAESFYGSRAFLEESGRAATGLQLLRRVRHDSHPDAAHADRRPRPRMLHMQQQL